MVCSKLAKRFDISAFAYAHRGLWTPDGPCENSLEACLAAAENGLGIEFDVRPSADGNPIVFHDMTLERMTEHEGFFENLTDQKLHNITLRNGKAVLTFETLLEHWPANTPLLCELKIDGNTPIDNFAARVGEMLARHNGPAAAMSFSKRAVSALPDTIMRGQLIYPQSVSGDNRFNTDVEHILNHQSIDYIACHWSDAETLQSIRHKSALPLITWTVRDAAQCLDLADLVDAQIFEGFDPKVAKSLLPHTSKV